MANWGEKPVFLQLIWLLKQGMYTKNWILLWSESATKDDYSLVSPSWRDQPLDAADRYGPQRRWEAWCLDSRPPTPSSAGEKECHKRDMGSSFCFLISCESTLIQPCWRFRSVSQGNAYFNLTIDILHWTKRKWWKKARKGLQRTWVLEMCLHHESKR